MPAPYDLGAFLQGLDPYAAPRPAREPAAQGSLRVAEPGGACRWTVRLWAPTAGPSGWSTVFEVEPLLGPRAFGGATPLQSALAAARPLRWLLDDAAILDEEAAAPPPAPPPGPFLAGAAFVEGQLPDGTPVFLGCAGPQPGEPDLWSAPLRIGETTRRVYGTDAVFATLIALRELHLRTLGLTR